MPNYNQFFSEAGTFSIDQAIKGQTPLSFYDPLRQVAYQPEVRRGMDGNISAVLPYADSGIWGLFSQLQAVLGSDKKTVKARKFWWAEYDQFQTFSFSIGKASGSTPAAGVGSSVTVSRASLSNNGIFAKPLGGYRVVIKELNRQNAVIRSVVTLPNGNYQITFDPINNQVLDLTQKNSYTVVLLPMRNFSINNSNDIQTEGMVKNPPALYQSFVQKYEFGFAVDESEIDNYIYDKNFFIVKGLNSRGEKVEYFYIPQLNVEAEDRIIANRTMRTLFNRKDWLNDQDFDGVIPTIENLGMFNYAYDIFLGGSFKSLLFSIIKSLRKINGSNEYLLVRDFNFGIDWGEAIAAIVRNYNQNYKFALFGDGGEGLMNFEYFKFQDFKWGNYYFRDYQMDMFDSYRYGRILDYFAMLMPAKSYTDTDGNKVPIMNYVNIEGAEPAKEQRVWIDDARERGARNLRVFVKDSFGIEIHKPTQLGMIWKGKQIQ